MAVEDRQGRAYDEGAFRYFLALEQQRSTRSGRAFLLVLVYLKGKAGAGARIDTTLAGPLVGRLWRVVPRGAFLASGSAGGRPRAPLWAPPAGARARGAPP